MKPLWTTWRCRNNANLFMLTLAVFIVVLLLVARTEFGEYLIPVLVVLGVYLLILTAQAVYRAWTLCRQQVPRSPLSRDELHKARSKLMKHPKRT